MTCLEYDFQQLSCSHQPYACYDFLEVDFVQTERDAAINQRYNEFLQKTDYLRKFTFCLMRDYYVQYSQAWSTDTLA